MEILETSTYLSFHESYYAEWVKDSFVMLTPCFFRLEASKSREKKSLSLNIWKPDISFDGPFNFLIKAVYWDRSSTHFYWLTTNEYGY